MLLRFINLLSLLLYGICVDVPEVAVIDVLVKNSYMVVYVTAGDESEVYCNAYPTEDVKFKKITPSPESVIYGNNYAYVDSSLSPQ